MKNEQVTKYGVAAVVVLYRPEQSVIDNISTYSDQVDIVLAVDNSESPNNDIVFKIKENKKIEYIKNDGNKGVAHALNLAAILAIKRNFRFLLTMDQDTRLGPGTVSTLINLIESVDGNNIGIISPIHFEQMNSPKLSYVLFTMTSANLLNLTIYQKIGPFREDFFIDHIDHEYCLRLNTKGFKVAQVGGIRIDHEQIGRAHV